VGGEGPTKTIPYHLLPRESTNPLRRKTTGYRKRKPATNM